MVPIWIAQSPKMLNLKEQWLREGQSENLTWFAVGDDESSTDALIRILPAVDQHHDESSQDMPYDAIWVIGDVDAGRVLEDIRGLGFMGWSGVLGGTLFLKSRPVSS